jgi:hypothetical protein
VIDFEIDSFLDDEDAEDLLLITVDFPVMPHEFGFCGHLNFVAFGTETSYGGFAGGAVGSTAVAASALRQVAKEQNYPLNDAVLRILLGHAGFESGFGRGDPKKNTLANTNNWGSVQATADWVRANLGKAGFGAVAHQDSDPKKGPFVGWYRVYPNAVEGARGFFNTVKPAITSDIDQYAANLYHRSYYGGVHANDPQANIRDYASAIRRAMPGSVPSDTAASVAEAQRFNVGPLAPAANRMTAKFKVDGKVKWPASTEDAKHAWDTSWSNPAAYGLGMLGKAIDFGSVMSTDGVVWLGEPPKGFAAAGRGSLAWLPLAGILIGGIAGLPWRIAGALIGSAIGGSLGYFAERLPFVTGLLALSASTPAAAPNAAILPAPGAAPPDLKAVQSKLNLLGMASPVLKPDGIMGQKTRAAIEKFQKMKGLMMTGVLDVATIKALGF